MREAKDDETNALRDTRLAALCGCVCARSHSGSTDRAATAADCDDGTAAPAANRDDGAAANRVTDAGTSVGYTDRSADAGASVGYGGADR